MGWVRLDDKFFENEKVEALEPDAQRLYLAALCYSSQRKTDGNLTRRMVNIAASHVSVAAKWAGELVKAGLFHETDEGFTIHDFLTYNPSKAEREERAAATKERVARWRDKRSGNADGNAVTDADVTSQETPPVQGYVPRGRGLVVEENKDSELERRLEAELRVKLDAGERIGSKDGWRKWRRPLLEAEMAETRAKRQRGAESYGATLAAVVEADEAADLIQGKFDDDYERELAMKGYEQNRAAS